MKSAAAESEAECNKRKQQERERERELEGDQGSPFSSCTSSQACGGGYGDYLHLQLQAQAHALGELSSKDHSLESLDSSGKPEIDPEGEPLALFYGALEPDDAYYDSLSHFSGRAGGTKKPRIQAHADYASSGCDRIAAASGAALASDPDLMLLDDSGNSMSCGGGMGGMGHLTSHSADEVMFRDFPHPRHVCVLFPFAPSPAVSNSACCNKCYCHACEEVAPCRLWGNGLQASDHCNATGSSWYWATRAQKSSHGFGASDVSGLLGYGGGMAAVSPRPSSMSGLSHGLYGPSFCSLAMCGCNGGSSGEHKLLHDESPDAECFSSSCLGASSMGFIPRGDPSTDLQWFEFGSVSVPIKSRQQHRSLVDLVEALDRFSMEIFAKNCPTPECGAPDTRPEQFQYVDVLGTSSSSSSADMHHHDGRVHSYDALIDELMLNEAQGQLQVIMTVIPESSYQHTGTAHIRIFLKKERGEEIITLKELLHEIFPDNLALQEYLWQVDQMRRWVESTDDWASFAGLLKDLESNGYREADQPSGLTVPLRPYQRQSLQFMLDAEHREGGLLSVNYHRLPPCGESSPPLLYSASLGHLMDGRDDAPAIRGGFLCEEMGLGKTIEILALILANPCSIERCSAVPAFSKGTLIVCPVSIVGQWANEVKSKLAANLSIYMYHGSKRIRDPKKLAKFDIVITTYATLGSDFSKATQATRHGAGFAEQFCPLLTVNWWRVVLDESHTVKDPAPLHSRACAKLKADRRWCCTGTPINTSIYDLYGQFLFLKLEPLDNKGIFRRRIGRPYERHCKSDDQTVLLWTLNKMMIRHTKQQKFNGRELLRLPPKTEQDIPVRFTLEERTAYETVYQKVITKFEEFRCWGPTVVSKNILQIMSLLLPLRRLCSGGFVSDLELNMHHKSEPNSAGAVADFCPSTSSPSLTTETGLGDPQGECGICFELMECPTKTPCGHWFCCECVMSALGIGSEACPVCRSALTASQLVTHQPKLKDAALPLVDLASFEELAPLSGNRPEDADAIKGVQMDSKLKVLLADLAKIRQENEGAKVLIFSQFMQTIAWLKTEFKKQGVNYRFISGDMPMKKRAQAIEAFQKDPPTTVFLLSIRTGAVGITLTAASHVYMLEPCLNPALEEQAVGRCWRMGQERPVVIKRLFVEDSVEANILKLLRTRSSHASLSSSQDSDSTSRPKGTKNGAGDVAGCIRTDKQNLRLNEFEILFS